MILEMHSIFVFALDEIIRCFFICTFFVSFLAIKKNHKESTKEKKEKNMQLFPMPFGHNIEGMLQAKPAP